MKKLMHFMSVLCVLVFASCLLAGCSGFFQNSNNKDEQNNENGVVVTEMKLADADLKLAANLCEVSTVQEPKLKASFRDDEYYYYYFQLGLINNVPLEGFSNLTRFVNHGQKVKIGFESSEVQTTTISSTITNTLQEQTSTKHEVNVKAGYEYGKKDVWKVKIDAGYSWFKNKVTTTSYTESYSNASTYSETEKKTVNMEFDEKAANGYYGYILTGAINVYSIVIYDVEADVYYVEYFSDIKEYWTDFYYFTDTNEFVNYEYETIEFTVPQNLSTPTSYYSFKEETYTPIRKSLNIYNCADNGKYDKNEKAGEADDRTRHDGFDVAELVLYGCTENGNNYAVGNKDLFSLKIHILQDVTDLPRVGSSKTSLSDDTATSVKGTNINSKIGYGAYWVRVTYTDDTQTQLNATNQFKDADSNTYIEILDSDKIDANKTISKIEVVIAYEFYCGGPGFLGIWWDERSNWRCEYEFNFLNPRA